MEKNSQNFSMEDVKRLANSPAGRQLIAMLQRTDGAKLQKAADLASAGDIKSAGQIINNILSSNDQAQDLIDQLGR